MEWWALRGYMGPEGQSKAVDLGRVELCRQREMGWTIQVSTESIREKVRCRGRLEDDSTGALDTDASPSFNLFAQNTHIQHTRWRATILRRNQGLRGHQRAGDRTSSRKTMLLLWLVGWKRLLYAAWLGVYSK